MTLRAPSCPCVKSTVSVPLQVRPPSAENLAAMHEGAVSLPLSPTNRL